MSGPQRPHQYDVPKDERPAPPCLPEEELIEIVYTRRGRRVGVLVAITPEDLHLAKDIDDLRHYRFTEALSMFCKTSGLKVYRL